MDVNNGSESTLDEPDVTLTGGADGKGGDNTLPEGSQSDGKDTQKSDKGSAEPAWLAQVPSDLKADPEVLKLLRDSPTIGDYIKATLKVNDDGSKKTGEEAKGNEPVFYEEFEKKLDSDADPFGVISDSLKEVLQGSNIPKDVAEKVFDSLSESQNKSTTQLIEKGKDWCEAQLKKNWGDDYDSKRKAMTRAYVSLVKPESDLAKALDKTGASINPAVAELLSRIGESIKEDGSVGSNQSGGGTGRDSKVPVHYPD